MWVGARRRLLHETAFSETTFSPNVGKRALGTARATTRANRAGCARSCDVDLPEDMCPISPISRRSSFESRRGSLSQRAVRSFEDVYSTEYGDDGGVCAFAEDEYFDEYEEHSSGHELTRRRNSVRRMRVPLRERGPPQPPTQQRVERRFVARVYHSTLWRLSSSRPFLNTCGGRSVWKILDSSYVL